MMGSLKENNFKFKNYDFKNHERDRSFRGKN